MHKVRISFVQIFLTKYKIDQLLDTAALNTHPLSGQSLVELLETHQLYFWTALALVQPTKTHVLGLSIAIPTLLLSLALYLHRLVLLQLLLVLEMKMGEKGTGCPKKNVLMFERP